MSPSRKLQGCLRAHSHDSVIFSYFWNSNFFSYGEFKMREIKLRIASPAGGEASGGGGVTAGKVNHNASNARAVTAAKMGCNSSTHNHRSGLPAASMLTCVQE